MSHTKPFAISLPVFTLVPEEVEHEPGVEEGNPPPDAPAEQPGAREAAAPTA